MNPGLVCRTAQISDAEQIAAIYNQGIEDRSATFETETRRASDISEWFDGAYPMVAVVLEGNVISFARTSPYSSRNCYSGIAEFSVYVHRTFRRMGAGYLAMTQLIQEARKRGFWKLVSRVFVENEASRRLLSSIGFREVGVYEKHARLDGNWKDVVIVEYVIEENTRDI